MQKEVIVLGDGCFWCTEAVFGMLKGIESVEPGYAGGHVENPTEILRKSQRRGLLPGDNRAQD